MIVKYSFFIGNVSSPRSLYSHSGRYPTDFHRTDTIQVEEGLILLLQFTAFDIYYRPNCEWDHLTITDNDGTTLLEKSCGSTSSSNVIIGGKNIGSSLPAAIRSRSNIVNLVFHTDSFSYRAGGWRVRWSAVKPGECNFCETQPSSQHPLDE